MNPRMMTFLGALVLAPVLALGTACSDGETDLDGAINENGSDNGVALQERERFETEVETRLRAIDADLASLEMRIRQQGDNVESGLQARLDALKQERTELSDKLRELRAASGDRWSDIRDDIDDSLRGLEQAIDEF